MDLHELWLRNLKMASALPPSTRCSFLLQSPFEPRPLLRPPSVQQVSLNSLARKLVFYERNFSSPLLGSFVYPVICAGGVFVTKQKRASGTTGYIWVCLRQFTLFIYALLQPQENSREIYVLNANKYGKDSCAYPVQETCGMLEHIHNTTFDTLWR